MSQTLEHRTQDRNIVKTERKESFSDKIAFPSTVAILSAVCFGYLASAVYNNSSVVKDSFSAETFVPLGIAFGLTLGYGIGYFFKKKIDKSIDRTKKKNN